MFGIFGDRRKDVVTRYAPSPTGKQHVGGIRTALYNYLYARQHGGTYILRSEDTDKARSNKEYEDYFLELFSWLGLEHDAFYRQSDRTAIYARHLDALIKKGSAYVSFEEPREPKGRARVIRFKNPSKKITFVDVVLGEVTFDTTELGDFVIARSFEEPLYHFTVVVDDFEMGVTHVIRGQEHLSNTPRQILLQEAIGAGRPVYAHASVILNEEREKMSKRDPLVRPALEYRDEGYLPEALLNFMAFLGWNPGGEREVMSLTDLVRAFSLERLHKHGAVFNPEKLLWFNREHMLRLSDQEFDAALVPFLDAHSFELSRYRKLIRERSSTFKEAADFLRSGEFSYLVERPTVEAAKLPWKNDGASVVRKHLDVVLSMVIALDARPTVDRAKSLIFPYADREGRGSVLWPLRYALSGREKSPDPFELIALLGRDESRARIELALTALAAPTK